MSDETR